MRVTDPHGTRNADMTMPPGTPKPLEIDPLRDPERRRRAAEASVRDIALGADFDSYLLPAVHDIVAPYIAAANEHGPIPRIRSEEFLDAPEAVQIAGLLTLGIAYLVADPHAVVRGALKQVSLDIHGADPEMWRRHAANHVPHEEMKRRRAAPRTPLRCAHEPCPTVVTVPHPLPADLRVLCPAHREDKA